MKHFFLFLCVFVLVVLGSVALSFSRLNPKKTVAIKTKPFYQLKGIERILKVTTLEGPDVSVTDTDTPRTFRSVLPPTFRDEHGVYTGNHAGESIRVLLSIKGDLANDRAEFLKQSGLTQFEDVDLAAWHVTMAFDSKGNRWVVRATTPDPLEPTKGYHALECLSASDSDESFWSGCRTMIVRGQIELPRL